MIVFGLIGLLLFGLGRCNFLFHPVGLVRSTPTPSSSGALVGTPTPSGDATSTPTGTPTAGGTPDPNATATPTPTPGSTSTPTPTARPTSTPTPGPLPLTIAGFSFDVGDVGLSYVPVNLNASGGKPPYAWSIGSGALPLGIGLSGATVQGTPGAAGNSSFTVRVTDSASGSAIAGGSITINPALSAIGNGCSKFCSVEQTCSICGVFGSQSGGTPPYQYAVSGPVPSGTSVSGLSLAGGFPLVYPNPSGTPFTVIVTDRLGQSASPVNGVFQVFPRLTFANYSAFGGSGQTTGFRMPWSGGTPSGVLTLGLISAPKGTTATVIGAVVSVSVPPQTSGNYKFQVGLTDQSLCGPGPGVLCSAVSTVFLNIK